MPSFLHKEARAAVFAGLMAVWHSLAISVSTGSSSGCSPPLQPLLQTLPIFPVPQCSSASSSVIAAATHASRGSRLPAAVSYIHTLVPSSRASQLSSIGISATRVTVSCSKSVHAEHAVCLRGSTTSAAFAALYITILPHAQFLNSEFQWC